MKYNLILKQIVCVILFLTYSESYAETNKKYGELIHRLDEIRITQNIPAFSFVIVDKDEIINSSTSGLMDLKTKKKLNIDTLIRIGSITKSFTALAILTLQQKNKINLNDPIKKYIDDLPLKNPWRKTNPVRISHLLEHSAGLLDLSKAEFEFINAPDKSIKNTFAFQPDNRVIMWPPGMFASYSNVGAGYLGYIIEKVTGLTYENYITDFILKPLQMLDSSFFLNKQTEKKLATGYDSDGITVIPYWHMIFRPFGAINTSTRQMASFVRLFLNDGKVDNIKFISKKNIRRMEIPETTLATTVGLKYGYGLANYTHLHKGLVFHGHGGDGDGYLTYYAYNRKIGLGYFIVINAFNNSGLYQMRMLIEDYITDNTTKPIPTIVYHNINLKKFVGSYKSITYRMPWIGLDDSIVKIVLQENKLYKIMNGVKKQLIPVNKFIFRLIDQTIATQAFIQDSEKMYFQNEDGNYIRINSIKD